jgi:predicted MPP superfamily phosphohydrolase
LKTAAIIAGKLIAGILIVILAESTILGISTTLRSGSQEPDKSQDKTELQTPQAPQGKQTEAGNTEPASAPESSAIVVMTEAANGTPSATHWDVMQLRKRVASQELQSWLQERNAIDYNTGWGEIIGMDGKYGFTVIHITDTQYLSQDNSWGNFTSWLASIKEALNVKMIIHTGDIVEHWHNAAEWKRADASMRILADADVPYTWCTGNHDFNLKNGSYVGSDYLSFNTSTFETGNYWLSSYDQQSTAVNWTYGGYKFIVVNLAYHANETALAWLTNILDTNMDSNIIVATHSYLNPAGGYGWYGTGHEWEENLKTLLDGYPNVFLTLSGHDINGNAYNLNVNDREEIFFNLQNTFVPSARILMFNATAGKVYVRTYLQYYWESSGVWLNSLEYKFSFDVDFTSCAHELE